MLWLGAAPGIARLAAAVYVVVVILSVFAALRPTWRTQARMAARRALLASRSAAERAAMDAVQEDRRGRLALLEVDALPLLRGIADGTLDPADREVQDQCARHAATLRRALTDRAGDAEGLLAGLDPALHAARARGLGTAWTSMHRAREQDVADVLGIPYDTVAQAVLTPLAYTKGTDFKPAARPDPDAVIHRDGW